MGMAAGAGVMIAEQEKSTTVSTEKSLDDLLTAALGAESNTIPPSPPGPLLQAMEKLPRDEFRKFYDEMVQSHRGFSGRFTR